MAFYARKYGLDHYRFARTRKLCNCFVCGEFIQKSEFRYADGKLSLCMKCADCWEKEGGKLGEISRVKQIIRYDETEKKDIQKRGSTGVRR